MTATEKLALVTFLFGAWTIDGYLKASRKQANARKYRNYIPVSERR